MTDEQAQEMNDLELKLEGLSEVEKIAYLLGISLVEAEVVNKEINQITKEDQA